MDRVTRAAQQVDDQFYRVLTVLRAVTLVYAVGVNAARWRDFEHPGAAWALIGVMVVWSGVVTWLYEPRHRATWVFVVDMLVTLALLRSTLYTHTDEMIREHTFTLTTYWVTTVVLCWAVRWGVTGGLLATAIVQSVDVTMRPTVNSSTVGNIFLMVLAAMLVGYCAHALRVSAVRRVEAERAAAIATERERLARAVHDGVLQVLALVQRRGAEIGGEAAELGRLAGEQELALRSLIQSRARDETAADGELVDLGRALDALAEPRVSVATPSRPVMLPTEVVDELVAAVLACRSNSLLHGGPETSTWILLEALDDRVVVSVRDDGPGIPAGRLEQAEAEGRMGVATSIKGRLRDLGGEADLVDTAGQGCEWELTVPLARVPGPAGTR
ncbi:MacS family sensor histidine kinase [Mumia sp. DW29H23]|uniref:MacS family sensor histidine kinase n=1 Tax=Mumia sp. DW29H23 TaxID=3421241 RepID=UPI003D690D26